MKGVTKTGDERLVWAKLADLSTLDTGEPSTIHVRVDQRTGVVEAPFVNAQLTLSGS